ncbi:MAG: pyridoxamine 5'-phosphate oxidase family protein [Acidobacteria bacterium]|nr:pyridoxamine 5'-phosphate oxidase family protein [Acidobacteriota bacterium]MBV9477154.1 pyridoxamine 5'-phosphate oxidase family protein [Acidobacteriota bacterium]
MNDQLERFRDLVKDLEVAMLTTRREDGLLVSRPMATQAFASGADLWFVTEKGSPKLAELAHDPNVNLGYYKDRTREWISVAGKARVVDDRAKIHELYRPDWRAWFDDRGGAENGGPDDPRMVLIAVDIAFAHFMEVNKPQAVLLFELAKGMVTGKRPDLPDVQTIDRTDGGAS